MKAEKTKVKVEALLIHADGKQEMVSPKNGKDFKLEELQAFVGGWIEILTLTPKRIIVVNEEGKCNQLPINTTATNIYCFATKVTDVVVGDVLVCNPKYIK